MAITIDHQTLTIHIPKSDLTNIQMVPNEIWQLDLNVFRLALKDIEDDVPGIVLLTTHNHVPPISVGGVTLARIVEIINGYTITFEDGQYSVNLVGANSNVADVVNPNQVSIRSANSAGLTYSKEIEDQSFLDGRIWVDPDNGVSGTQFPIGTHGRPVNNHIDADSIVSARQLSHRYALKGFLVETSPGMLSGENWLGESPSTSGFTFSGGVNISGSVFRNVRLSGSVTGRFHLENGFVESILGFMGDCQTVGFAGTITLPSGAHTDIVVLKDCYSNVPGTNTPIFDFNNATNVNWQFRGWTGGLEIRNFNDVGNVMSIDLVSGHVKLHSSCTAGTIVIRGAGHITDNSNGITVIKTGLVHTENLLQEKRWIALQ